MSVQPLSSIQAITVARAYFIERKTKSQIAEDLNLSRFRVARLIEEAIERGLVKFVIEDLQEIDTELSQRLQQMYNLNQAVVLSGPDLPAANLTQQLGKLGASVVEELLKPNMNVGIASGRVLSAMADAIGNLPPLNVIQAAGAQPGMDFSHNSIELVHRIASIGGGKAFPIYVPMWVDNPDTARNLLQEPSVSAVHKMYESLDVLLTGIGSWQTSESCMCNTFPDAWRTDALDAGVCADICATIIDRNGDAVPSPLDKVGLSMTASQVRNVPQVVAIAGGIEKREAIAASLKGGWVSTLVTDAGVARFLLSLQ
ncbi:sugar-binding transcriptional regulator [Raoultella planticola]|mgnify:CR=1 FL=1|uniref:Sugar-binding domain-containing protein n=1 Tax=Raoultella scottii TaxID=3040937 RepID=A0ABU8Z1J8_9ENTR|nr:sugar-binding domain-containing protein [uncultured Citrobacter sp.]